MEIKRGNTSFNVEAFKDWNKNQFLLQYCGIVKGVNLSEVWEEIQKLLGNDTKSDKGFGEKTTKKSKSKRDNETSISANEFPQTDN
jgi:hypothetical protein